MAEDNKEVKEKSSRKIILVCGKCKYHDMDENVFLEINFASSQIYYVCRNCGHENSAKLNSTPPSLPRIGVGVR